MHYIMMKLKFEYLIIQYQLGSMFIEKQSNLSSVRRNWIDHVWRNWMYEPKKVCKKIGSAWDLIYINPGCISGEESE